MRKKTTSSEEFIKGYEQIWKKGPTVKYTNPDAWTRTPIKGKSQS